MEKKLKIISKINKEDIIGKIYGKNDIYYLNIDIIKEINNLDFVKIKHYYYGDVMGQVVNITNEKNIIKGKVKIIGYKKKSTLETIKKPFKENSKIILADKEFIEKIIGLNGIGAYIGSIDNNKDIKIKLDIVKLITKHMSILAKTGTGKSYTSGVIIEELMLKGVPMLIIDPHNEYSSLKFKNKNASDLLELKKLKLKPIGFKSKIKEFCINQDLSPNCEKIELNLKKIKINDLINLLPRKITQSQEAILYTVFSNLENNFSFNELIFHISNEDNNAKWALISMIEEVKKLKIYSENYTPIENIIKNSQTSILNFRGIDEKLQDNFLNSLLIDLFKAIKLKKIPKFFLVIDEAHNYAKEKGNKITKSGKIIKTISKEGRKFGLGLCVISQRPQDIDKGVLSQCSTQILLKITNPNDLKIVVSSSEGIDSDSSNEIQRLNIGTCLLTGMVDLPLKIKVRPRLTQHGGE